MDGFISISENNPKNIQINNSAFFINVLFFLLYNPSLVIFHEKENLPIILSFKYRFFFIQYIYTLDPNLYQ